MMETQINKRFPKDYKEDEKDQELQIKYIFLFLSLSCTLGRWKRKKRKEKMREKIPWQLTDEHSNFSLNSAYAVGYVLIG